MQRLGAKLKSLRIDEFQNQIYAATVLPEFFIKMLTDPDDVVVDPFAASNTTGMVAEKLGRRWIAIELSNEYLQASKFRFDL